MRMGNVSLYAISTILVVGIGACSTSSTFHDVSINGKIYQLSEEYSGSSLPGMTSSHYSINVGNMTFYCDSDSSGCISQAKRYLNKGKTVNTTSTSTSTSTSTGVGEIDPGGGN